MRTFTHICVFAGSNAGTGPGYAAAARELGRVLVERGVGLVYGGGRVGLMGVIADTMLAGGGHVIGVIPHALVAREVGHTGLPDLRVVDSMHERKALMAELADGFIALPGGMGTLEEFCEVLTWGQLGLHSKPCGLLNVGGYYDGLVAFFRHSVDEGFLQPEHADMVCAAASPPDLIDLMARYTPPVVEKWIDRRTT